MPSGVDLSGLGDDGGPVVKGDGDGGGGGIHGEQEHANSLRLRRRGHGAPYGVPARPVPAATVTVHTRVRRKR
ncbi:hypothetical protein GCM10015535_29300 [Streptomyces gelaticus]|uniref:Uncharacterized protein n=1 Tax=Streptomyces gelaticus TaxID=285446 RepID=A0ABQ2VYD6_9ACTN|nr:hypothetical protein GCM10015535_29300 [Streptomyces gelaticus]